MVKEQHHERHAHILGRRTALSCSHAQFYHGVDCTAETSEIRYTRALFITIGYRGIFGQPEGRLGGGHRASRLRTNLYPKRCEIVRVPLQPFRVSRSGTKSTRPKLDASHAHEIPGLVQNARSNHLLLGIISPLKHVKALGSGHKQRKHCNDHYRMFLAQSCGTSTEGRTR